MHSQIPPRWRIFEAATPTRGGAAGKKYLVGEEGVVAGAPSQLRFPAASAAAGAPEQAAYLAHAIEHAKREAHAESAAGFERGFCRRPDPATGAGKKNACHANPIRKICATCRGRAPCHTRPYR